MIDPLRMNAYPANLPAAGTERPRFHMKHDPDARTAGGMPAWENNQRSGAPASADASNFQSALHYATTESETANAHKDNEGFGFGDLIDIVNPLHHIPLVGALYEGVTGDGIKPSGRVIGGALFGGFAGAAAGIANVIVEEETGKDMAGNVVALVRRGDLPQTRKESLTPEEHLDRAARLAFQDIDAETLPPFALGLQASKPHATHSRMEYERFRSDDDRIAGTMARYSKASSKE